MRVSQQWAHVHLRWLVGYLEGEGTFRLNAKSRGYGHYRSAVVEIHTTDADIAQRVARRLCTDVRGPYGPYAANKQPFYSVALWGPRAVKLMRAVRPHMGARRRQQIARVISAVPGGNGREP